MNKYRIVKISNLYYPQYGVHNMFHNYTDWWFFSRGFLWLFKTSFKQFDEAEEFILKQRDKKERVIKEYKWSGYLY